jgi:hypothetical protein
LRCLKLRVVWLEILWLPVGENDEVYVLEVLHNVSLVHLELSNEFTTSLCLYTGSKRLLGSQPHSFSLCPYNNATPRPAQVYLEPDHKFPEFIATQLNTPFRQQLTANTTPTSDFITPDLSNTAHAANSTSKMSSQTNPQRRGTKRAADDESDTSHWVRRSTRAHKMVKYFENPYAEVMEDTPDNVVEARKVTNSATSDDTDEYTDDKASDTATDDTADRTTADDTDNTDFDPVVPPGRTRKSVDHSEGPCADLMDDVTDDSTSDDTDENPVVPPGHPRKITKCALPHNELVENVSNDTVASPTVKAPKASKKAEVKKKPIAAAPSPMPSLDESEEEYDHGAAIAAEWANQEAALALLQPHISCPTSLITVFGESAMRDSLEPDKVKDDLCAAAAGLRELSVEAADSQEDDRSTSVKGSDSNLTSAEDKDEDVVPPASNKYKFTSDSSTGRTADELNSLFRPPPRMPRWQMDLDTEIKLSYTQLGVPPRDGLVRDLVKQMKKQHEKDVQKAEKEIGEMSESKDEDEED